MRPLLAGDMSLCVATACWWPVVHRFLGIRPDLQRRKPWGDGGTRPPRIWSGGRQCIMSPDFDIFSAFFPYLERQRKILYIVFISLTSNCHCAALTTR